MKKNLINRIGTLTIICLSLLCYTCLGPKVHELDFYSVSMNDPLGNAELGIVSLIGNVDENASGALVNQGFLISESITDLENNSAEELQGVLGQNNTFTYELNDLSLEKTYYIKAFATFEDDRVSGQRKVYTDTIWPFSFSIFLGTNESITVVNDQAEVSGFITGLQNLGTAAEEHGFIYSANTSALLELGEAQSKVLERGLLNDDDAFIYILSDLDLNTTYRVRTYAKTATDIFYSNEIRTFQTKDGWKLLQNDGFQLIYGFGLTVNDKAYFLGCDDCCPLVGCTSTNTTAGLPQPLYGFDPSSNSGLGEWFESGSELPFFRRHNALAFQIEDTLYFGTGLSQLAQKDFYKICVCDIGVVPQMEDLMVLSIPNRSGGVAFVLNNKAYIGLGKDLDGNVRNDFWEYDPQTGVWREVATMPRRETENGPIDNGGRREAMAFVLGDGYAYVGGGFSDIMLKDFWRFDPPENSSSQGAWTWLDFFEGPGRLESVHFTLDGKGYFGTGNNIDPNDPEGGNLNDFWVFDPNETPLFEQRTSLPSDERSAALGFAIGSNGYLGYGQKIIVNNDMSTSLEPVTDLWIYTPRE